MGRCRETSAEAGKRKRKLGKRRHGRGYRCPLYRWRGAEHTLFSDQDHRSKGGSQRVAQGGCRKGKERGKTGKENKLQGKGRVSGGGTFKAQEGATSLSLSLLQCQCPAARTSLKPQVTATSHPWLFKGCPDALIAPGRQLCLPRGSRLASALLPTLGCTTAWH